MDLHEVVQELKRVYQELGRMPTRIEFLDQSKVKKYILEKHGFKKVCAAADLKPVCEYAAMDLSEKRPPRILAFDIETAPMEAYIFACKTEYVPYTNIKRDWFIMSIAAKFVDEDKIYYWDVSRQRNKLDDSKIVARFLELAEKADFITGHNIKRFDTKKINTRHIKTNSAPPPMPKQIDTLSIARKYFSFTSNSLDYIAQYLGCTPKMKDRKYNGMRLWIECLANNREAWDEMELYNKQDVLTQIEVFEKLKVYDASLNFQAFHQKPTCICGSVDFRQDGIAYTNHGQFQRYRCYSCGKRVQGKENLIHKDIRKGFFK
jgi:DNA polymerase elongation subunit (family B)